MQDITFYSLNEIVALVTSVMIGTGAYLGVIILKKHLKVNLSFVFWIFIMNLFVTHLLSELLKVMKWGEYRSLALPAVAYAGQYFIDWVDKRYLKIFDAGIKKAGLDINENNDQNYEDNQGEDNDSGGDS